MRSRSVRLLSLVACGASLALPSIAQAQTSARDTLPVVRSLEIVGNQAFSDAEIKRGIVTRASGCKSVVLAPFCWIGLGVFKRTERLDPREFRTDVARIRVYYFRRGYRRAEVDTSLVRDEGVVDVTIQIDEGQPVVVRSLTLEGLEGVEGADEVRLEDLPLLEGGLFSEVDITASKESIERELRNQGYANAAAVLDAEIPREDTLGAYVTLRIVPGARFSVGTINVQGTVNVDSDNVRRLLTFRSGDVFSEEEMARSERTLYSMALFDYAAIEYAPASDSVMDVLVQVNEAKPRAIQFGMGVSTTECFQVEGGWTHRNLFGGTRSLELTGVLSNLGTSALAQSFPCNQAGVPTPEGISGTNPYNKVNWRLRADFSQPWFLGSQNWLNVGLFTERQSLPAIYARVSYGASLRVSREIAPGTAVIASWRPGLDELEEGSADFLWCANFGICDPDDITALSEPRRLSWIALTIAQSRTDAVLNPTTGYRWTLEGETASRFTRSEWAYYRAAGEASWFTALSERTVLGLRLRAALVRPIGSGIEGIRLGAGQEPVTQPLKRTYAGGAFTVRGYGQNLLGPKVLVADSRVLAPGDSTQGGCDLDQVGSDNTWVCEPEGAGLTSNNVFPRPIGGENVVVGNIELRVPFGSGRWTGVAFVDVGRVWNTGGAVAAAEGLAWSPGIGVRYQSPVGPLRLDIGYNTGGAELLPVVTFLQRKADSEIVKTEEERMQCEEEGGCEIVIVQLVDEEGRPASFTYNPYDDFVSRLQLHFSIGHAF